MLVGLSVSMEDAAVEVGVKDGSAAALYLLRPLHNDDYVLIEDSSGLQSHPSLLTPSFWGQKKVEEEGCWVR